MGSMYNAGERADRLHKLKHSVSPERPPTSATPPLDPSQASLPSNLRSFKSLASIPSIFETLTLPLFGLGWPKPTGGPGHLEKLLGNFTSKVDDSERVSILNLTGASAQKPQQLESAPTPTKAPEPSLARSADAILQAFKEWPGAVICAPTGSGKTTWLPRFLAEHGASVFPEGVLPEGASPMVYISVPRRIQTVRIAQYLSELLESPLGEKVGYHNGKTGRSTPGVSNILVLTHGFLREMLRHNEIPNGSFVLVDEVHEQPLALSGIFLRLDEMLKQGMDIKVGTMSAKLQTELFSDYFGGIPIIDPTEGDPSATPITPDMSLEERILATANKGRTHKIVGIPPLESVEDDIVAAVNRGETPIVFVAGKKDIERISERVSQIDATISCRPFHAQLPHRAQQAIFEQVPGERTAIIATNVGGTGLTYPPHINTVIITPEVKRMSHVDGVDWLRRQRITVTEVIQLLGRVARIKENGLAVIRLPKSRHQSREADLREHIPPEIQNVSVATEMLKDLAVRRDPYRDNRRFILQASSKQLFDAHELLYKLDLVGPQGDITKLGRAAAELPVSAHIGKLLAKAIQHRLVHPNVLKAAIDIAAIADAESITAKDKTWQKLRVTNTNADPIAHMEAFQHALSLGLHQRPEELSEYGLEEAPFFMALDTRNSLRNKLSIRSGDPDEQLTPVELRLLKECLWSALIPWLHRCVEDRDDQYYGEQMYKKVGEGGLRLLSKGSVVKRAEFIVGIPLNLEVDEMSERMSLLIKRISAPPKTLPLLLSAVAVDRDWLEHNIPPQCREAREAFRSFGKGRPNSFKQGRGPHNKHR